MSADPLRRLVRPARVRVGGGVPAAAVVGAAGSRRVRLGMREEEARRLWDRGAGGRIEVAPGPAGTSRWLPVSDLRLGAALGSGENGIRRLILTLDEALPGPETARGFDPIVVAADAPRVLPPLPGLEVVGLEEALDRDSTGAMVLGGAGGNLTPDRALECIRRFPGLRVVLLTPDGPGAPRWAEVLEAEEVFFACAGVPGPPWLGALVRAAAEDAWFRRAYRELVPRKEREDGFPAFAWYEPVTLGRRRAVQQVIGDLAARAERRIPGVRATVHAADEWAQVLIGPQPVEEGEWADSLGSGLTALAARTGRTVFEKRPKESVFFDEDPDGSEEAGAWLLAAPVRDLVGSVLGVLTLRPVESAGPPGPEMRRQAAGMAARFHLPLAALREKGRARDEAGANRSLFRAEAIEAHRRSESPSAILNVSTRWGRWITAGLAAFLVAFGLFLALGSASEYAEGGAVVRGLNRVPVVANTAGTVAAVRLAAGAGVTAGEVIGTLHDAAELAQVERLEREYEEALVRLLRNPEDPAAGGGLAALRGTSEAARSALEQRQLIAPADGVLADVRVRVGALVSPGQTVATIRTEGAAFELVAAVPGNFRPLLRAGIPVVAELDQFPGSRLHLKASYVNPEVVEAEEARALIGPAPLSLEGAEGPLALVHAALPGAVVRPAGEEVPLYDGMRGRVRIPVRQQRFIVTLWPALGRRE